MWKQLALSAAICAGLLTQAVPAAADVIAQLFPFTGEVRLLNTGAAPVPFVFYSITSEGGALDGSNAVWKSIADHYDVSGNGLIDPYQEWFELADDPDELTEAVFMGPGGSLPAMRAISLGQIWNAAMVLDLEFAIHDDEGAIPVSMQLAIDGDYSLNQVVDTSDYVVWRKYLNSTTVLLADGNLDGVVDAADYLVFQQNFGRSPTLPPVGSGGGSFGFSAQAGVVPEPTTAALLIASFGWLGVLTRRRRSWMGSDSILVRMVCATACGALIRADNLIRTART